MATEKKWDSRNINIQVSDTDDATTSGKFLFQWYTMLSGSGANGLISGSWGTATSPWVVVTASNGTSGAKTWGDYTDASSSATSGGGARSWVLFKNSNLGHPTGSLYMCIDNCAANDRSIHLSFDHQAPATGSVSETSAPTFTDSVYRTDNTAPNGSTDIQCRPDYDASNPTYFHGTMDTTGSFIVVTGQNQANASYYNFPFTCAVIRLESPRSSSVDPYKDFIKASWWNATNGPWSNHNFCAYQTYTAWNYSTGIGHAMWWKGGEPTATGFAATFMTPAQRNGYGPGMGYYSPPVADIPGLDKLDGTSPMMPNFVYLYTAGYYSIRGRLPDVLAGWGTNDTGQQMDGLATPATGTPEYAYVGNNWLPFTGALQPGN